MSPNENEFYGRALPGPLPFPLVAVKIMSNVDLSPAQNKSISLLNLTYFRSVAELEKSYIDELYKIIDDVSQKV